MKNSKLLKKNLSASHVLKLVIDRPIVDIEQNAQQKIAKLTTISFFMKMIWKDQVITLHRQQKETYIVCCKL